MDEHLTKALYLGMAALLFAMAFTAFFRLYADYEDYCATVADSANKDSPQTREASSGDFIMKGDAVVNLILEKRRDDENIMLQDLYDETAAVSDPLPETYVDGVDCAACDLMSINAEDDYNAHFTFDSSGKPVRIDLYKR